jgi:hypothetical protein
MQAIPWPITGALFVAVAVGLALGGLYVVRHMLGFPRRAGDHDVAGVLYATVGAIYGVLLAFIVIVVWDRYSAANQAVTAEAADLVVAFRDTQTFPEPQRQQAQDGLRAYANEVMDDEWTTHVGDGPHRTPDPLNPVWAVYRSLQPTDSYQQSLMVGAQDRLHDLEQQRHLRHLSGEKTLPELFWPVLILGALATIGFSYFFRPADLRSQAIMTATLAGLIGAVLFVIFSLNSPFTGRVHVSQEPFRHALQQFNALNLQAPE